MVTDIFLETLNLLANVLTLSNFFTSSKKVQSFIENSFVYYQECITY